MAALTAERDTARRDGASRSFGVAASTKVYAGALVTLANGYAEPGKAASSKIAVGRAEKTVDNGSGSAGDLNIEVTTGIFRWNNDTTTGRDVRERDVGSECYVVDDQTVGRYSTGRSKAGEVFAVDDYGVWVRMGV